MRMSLKTAIASFVGSIEPSVKKSERKWAKCNKERRVYESADGKKVIYVDKNRQIVSGPLKGRPVLVENHKLLVPVTHSYCDDDGYHTIFDHYDVVMTLPKE